MLDNIVGEELHSAAKQLKENWKGKREFLIETSGGIVEGGLVERLGPDIDILSTSAVHQVSPLVELLLRTELTARAVNMSTFRSKSNQGKRSNLFQHVVDYILCILIPLTTNSTTGTSGPSSLRFYHNPHLPGGLTRSRRSLVYDHVYRQIRDSITTLRPLLLPN